MGGVGGIERGKWRQLYLNNNKKIKERQNHESLMGKTEDPCGWRKTSEGRSDKSKVSIRCIKGDQGVEALWNIIGVYFFLSAIRNQRVKLIKVLFSEYIGRDY